MLTDFLNNFLMGIKEIFSDKPCSLLSYSTIGELAIILFTLIFVLPTLLFFTVSVSYRLYRLLFCKNTVHAYVIKTRKFPRSNVSGIAVYPFILVNTNIYENCSADVRRELLNHELTHIHQQHETFVIFGYLVYSVEYFIRFLILRNRDLAYRSLSMEYEAYSNQNNLHYLSNRRRFAWVKYLFTKNN